MMVKKDLCLVKRLLCSGGECGGQSAECSSDCSTRLRRGREEGTVFGMTKLEMIDPC